MVTIQKSAEKDLERIKPPDLRKIVRVIDALAANPRPQGVQKLKGVSENFYRVRIGDYRIIYTISDEVRIVNIRWVGHRKDIYRNL